MTKNINNLYHDEKKNRWIYKTDLNKNGKSLRKIIAVIPKNKSEIHNYLVDSMGKYPEYTECYFYLINIYRKEKVPEDKNRLTDKVLDLMGSFPENKEYYKKLLDFYYK